MRLLLINTTLTDDPGCNPLEMPYAAGALSAAGHEVLQYDPVFHGPERLGDLIRFYKPGAVIIMLPAPDCKISLTRINALIAPVRGLIRIPVIMAGRGFSLFPDVLLKRTDMDFGVTGVPGSILCELIRDLEAGRDDIPEVLTGNQSFTAQPLYQKDLFNFYWSRFPDFPLIRSGCPLENLQNELENMPDLSEKLFCFTDPVFNDPKRNFKSFCRKLAEAGTGFHYSARLSPAFLKETEPSLLKESGCVQAEADLYAASDQTLAALGRGFSFSQASEFCRKLTDKGIRVRVNAAFGGPGETVQSISDGLVSLPDLSAAEIVVTSGLRLAPGSPLCGIARKKKMIPRGWDGFRMLYYFEPGIDPEKLHWTLLEEFNADERVRYSPENGKVPDL